MTDQTTIFGPYEHQPKRERYWLTPEPLMAEIEAEHGPLFDPCPYPLPAGWNGLTMPWPQDRVAYVNPPFKRDDGLFGAGPGSFAAKAIQEHQERGVGVVFVATGQHWIALMLQAGAQLSSIGRVRWREVHSGKPMPGPSQTIMAYLPPKR